MTTNLCLAAYPIGPSGLAPCSLTPGHEGSHETRNPSSGLLIMWNEFSAAEYLADGSLHQKLPLPGPPQDLRPARVAKLEGVKKRLLDAKRAYHDALFADESIDTAYDAMNEALDRYDEAQDLASNGILSELPRASVGVVRAARNLMDAIRGVV
jgi:hypothetical protein